MKRTCVKKYRGFVPAAVLAGLLGGAATAAAENKPNLLLITIDTLRPDRLSCYGSPYVKTPHLDAVAAKGALFTRAFAHNPLTLPSHVNIMVGATPVFHGMHENANSRLPDGFLTLAEHLKSEGYATAAFVGAFSLDSRFGLNQGFDVYDDNYPAQPAPGLMYSERRAEEVVSRALAWLKDRKSPWFCWVHVWDPHAPYFPPQPYATQYKKDLYSGEVAYADAELGKLFAALGGREDVFIIVSGDHGESLGEHGEMAHGYFAYNSTVWVPMFMAGPGIKTRKIQDNVGHIDIFPTACDLLRVKKPKHLQGQSLVPAIAGKKFSAKPVYFESMEPYYHRGWAPLRGFIEGNKKYFDSPIPEFYDLEKDFNEAVNLAPKTDLKDFLARLRKMEKDMSSGSPARMSRSTDRDTRQKLRSLGYVASPLIQVKDKYGPKDDLKTLQPYEQKFDRALVLESEGKAEESIRLLREIASERKDFGKAYTQIAYICQQEGKPAEAVKIMEEAFANNPQNYFVNTVYGLQLARAGATDKAIEIFQGTLAMYDQNPEVWNHLGVCFWKKGEYDKALEHYRKALSLDQSDALIYSNLGALYLSMFLKSKKPDDRAAAVRNYEKAVDLDPMLASAYNGLGGSYKIGGEIERAVSAWEKALEINPDLDFSLYNLGVTYLEMGNRGKALVNLEKYLRLKKNKLPARELSEIQELIRKCKGE